MKELWIIPLIGLVLWVLTYVLRTSTQEKTRQRSRPSPNRPRKGPSDLDRYLEAARQQQNRPEEPPVVLTPAPPRPVAQAPRRTRPGAPQRRRSAREEVPVVLQLAPIETRPSLAERLEAPPPPPPAPKVESAPAAPARLTAPPAAVVARPQTIMLGEIGRLMKSPASLRAAFLLNEVLGPPLSRRPQGRGPLM